MGRIDPYFFLKTLNIIIVILQSRPGIHCGSPSITADLYRFLESLDIHEIIKCSLHAVVIFVMIFKPDSYTWSNTVICIFITSNFVHLLIYNVPWNFWTQNHKKYILAYNSCWLMKKRPTIHRPKLVNLTRSSPRVRASGAENRGHWRLRIGSQRLGSEGESRRSTCHGRVTWNENRWGFCWVSDG